MDINIDMMQYVTNRQDNDYANANGQFSGNNSYVAPVAATPMQLVPMPLVSTATYEQLGYQYGKVYEQYLAAKQEISNLRAGMPENDFGLLEDASSKTMYLAKGAIREFFAPIIIDGVQMLSLENPYGKDFRGFAIFFIWDNGRSGSILVSEKTLDTPRLLIQEFEKAGVAITLNRNQATKHTLLRRLIISKLGTNVVVFPYLQGWSGNGYCYVTANGAAQLRALGFAAPSLQKHFAENPLKKEEIYHVIKQSIQCFGENAGMLLLSIAIGAILHTPLHRSGFSLGALLAIDCKQKYAREARKYLQLWDTEIQIPLSKGRNFSQSMCNSKDEVAFILDEGSSYSMEMGKKFEGMLRDEEVQNPFDNTTVELQAVPILLTDRIAAWAEVFEDILCLPLPDDIQVQRTDTGLLSAFYRTFCDWLNTNAAWLPDMISSLKIETLHNAQYSDTYRWLMAANQIFIEYLKMIGISCPINLYYFDEFVQEWLRQAEMMGELSLGEIFMEKILEFKAKKILTFENISRYSSIRGEKLFVFFDDEFVYIPAQIFKRIVENFLGYNYPEVYKELVKMDYAVGECGHVFPKVTVALTGQANGGQRVRMAKLQRYLLLSDEEALLGV